MVYKDMCFCANDNCKKREECYRNLDNHANVPEEAWISCATFECDKEMNMFILIK